MKLSREICSRAMKSKDPKFDGKFFIGVHSTGIYCRPICPAPTPKLKNIQFYPSAAAAADEGLRPCLRCKPEIAPGVDWLEAPIILQKALQIISEKFPNEIKMDELAAKLNISYRHLRRLFQQYLGTTPFSVRQTQKIHFVRRHRNCLPPLVKGCRLPKVQLRILKVLYFLLHLVAYGIFFLQFSDGFSELNGADNAEYKKQQQ